MSTKFGPFTRNGDGQPAATPTGGTARWRRQRARHLGTALEAIEQVGPAVTLTEIVERMGLAAPEVEHFFGGEAGLQDAIAGKAHASLLAGLMPRLDRRDTIDALAASLASRYLRWIRRNQRLADYSGRHFAYRDGPLGQLREELLGRGVELLQQVLQPHDLPGGELWALAEEIIDVAAVHGQRVVREGPALRPLPFARPDARVSVLAGEISALIVKRGRSCGVEIATAERLG